MSLNCELDALTNTATTSETTAETGTEGASSLPVSYWAEKMRFTNHQGHFVPKPTVLGQDVIISWVRHMRRLIAESATLSQFEDFFFFTTYCYGVKVNYDPLSGDIGVVSAFTDLNFNQLDHENGYFDFATNVYGEAL